jgi:hypothetical protein
MIRKVFGGRVWGMMLLTGFLLGAGCGGGSSTTKPVADGGGDAASDGGSGDPFFDHVVLLMHFDGDDAATTFKDMKGHVVTPNGASKLTTMTKVFGGASGAFDGSSAYLTLDVSNDWNFGSGDFTVELFVNFKGGIPGQLSIPTLFGFWGPTATNQSWEFLYNKNFASNNQTPGTLMLVFSVSGSDEVVPAVPWAPVADTWIHLAAVRHGGDFLYFADGALIGKQSIDANGGVPDWTRADPANNSGVWSADPAVGSGASIHMNTTARLSIGVGVGAPGTVFDQSYLKGYMDEARITKGIARYTANFARPTSAFPDN